MRAWIIKALGGYTRDEMVSALYREGEIWRPLLNRASKFEDIYDKAHKCLEYKFDQMLLGNKQKYNGRTVIAVPVCNRKRNEWGQFL